MMKRLAAMVAALSLVSVLAARAEGPTRVEVERAVDRGLKFLRDKQQRDGSFPASIGTSAVTSLSALAFMARGHLPGEGEYGDTINRAVDYVLASQTADGLISTERMSHAMYDHGISTVMLCEAYGMVSGKTAAGVDRRQAIKTAVAKSIRVILAAQQVPKPADQRGGWRYSPASTDSDISVTGWQLMALRGAANLGGSVPKRAIDDGIAYILQRQNAKGGFSYVAGEGDNAARTGTGVLALQLLGQHDSPQARLGGQYLLNVVQNKHDGALDGLYYYYSVYYCSQAASQLGDKYDRQINDTIRTSLIKNQKENGSWSASTSEIPAGEAYATAMACLALSVQFRYLPLYQLK